jgi:hypothetical protein
MIEYRTVQIPTPLYEKARQLAQERHQPVNELITDALNETLSFWQHQESLVDFSEPDEDVDREMAAYLAMHSMLWQKYPGQHVAVYKGELIDRDTDLNALYKRIDKQFPDQFVWITTVSVDPIEAVQVTSIRLNPMQ